MLENLDSTEPDDFYFEPNKEEAELYQPQFSEEDTAFELLAVERLALLNLFLY